MRKMVLLSGAALLLGSGLAAQQPAANDPAALVRGGFDEVSGWVLKAADLVPADKYSYKPVPAVRSFGQLIGHIADGQNYYCARAAGRTVEWSDAVEKGSQDKAVLIQKLKDSNAVCAAASTGAVGPLMANVAHDNLHYGNIITYMRMLSLVPPSS